MLQTAAEIAALSGNVQQGKEPVHVQEARRRLALILGLVVVLVLATTGAAP